jgi:hypothetical protein
VFTGTALSLFLDKFPSGCHYGWHLAALILSEGLLNDNNEAAKGVCQIASNRKASACHCFDDQPRLGQLLHLRRYCFYGARIWLQLWLILATEKHSYWSVYCWMGDVMMMNAVDSLSWLSYLRFWLSKHDWIACDIKKGKEASMNIRHFEAQSNLLQTQKKAAKLFGRRLACISSPVTACECWVYLRIHVFWTFDSFYFIVVNLVVVCELKVHCNFTK